MPIRSFADLGLHDSFCKTLEKAGYTQPTPIQTEAIPEILKGADVLGLAQTGTGKTAAFGLPLLNKIKEEKKGRAEPKCPRSLILAPTRELAIQIHLELEKLASNANLYVACVIGGVSQHTQVKKLHSGVDVLVAAPGRLLDLMNQGHVNLSKTNFLILDECDRLLDMGFIPDVRRILAAMPKKRQSLLFSATMPKEIVKFSQEILDSPVSINVSPKEVSVAKIDQLVFSVKKGDKPHALHQLVREKDLKRAIVFTRTKHQANRIHGALNDSGCLAEVIHGNKTQAARQRAMQNFKKGNAWILVATDIAARGIDINDVTHVINYELPQEPESYVHRIGRTARAGASGVAWSLLDDSEKPRLRAIERLIRKKITISELEILKEFRIPKIKDRKISDESKSQKNNFGRNKKSTDQKLNKKRTTHKGKQSPAAPTKRNKEPDAATNSSDKPFKAPSKVSPKKERPSKNRLENGSDHRNQAQPRVKSNGGKRTPRKRTVTK